MTNVAKQRPPEQRISSKPSEKTKAFNRVIDDFSNAPVGFKLQNVKRSRSSNARRAGPTLKSDEILMFLSKMNHRRTQSR